MTIRPRNSNKSGFSRDAWLEINLKAIEENYYLIRDQLQPNIKLMVVLKSDAYGHGASVIAPLLEACGAEYFGVASVDEGIQLREAGVKNDILILSPAPHWALERALSHNLQLTISSSQQISEIKKCLEGKKSPRLPVGIQIKINTGMNRNGIKWNDGAIELIQDVLKQNDVFELKGVFSHLACKGGDFFSDVQVDRFRKVISDFSDSELGLKHIAASSGLSKTDFQFDMVRVGLSLYGINSSSRLPLKPAMNLMARISQLQEVSPDEGVGYNLTWKAQENSLIGLLPLGYADGVKRGLSNRIRAIYNGRYINQVGNISMDQMSFDLTDCVQDDPKVGDLIVLLGVSDETSEQMIEVREWAQILGTIEYEVVCDLRARLPRVYVRK